MMSSACSSSSAGKTAGRAFAEFRRQRPWQAFRPWRCLRLLWAVTWVACQRTSEDLMPTFGVICEGPTDFPVLENLLTGFFGDATVNEIQPARALRGAPPPPGGWLRVFEAIKANKHAL